MSDRTSAEIFGIIFDELAKPNVDPKKLAKKLWKQSFQYDFSPCQMESDKALIKLGLAKEMPDPDYPEDGPRTVYREANGRSWGDE